MTTIAFDARRFQSTAAYYSRYRVPYPDVLITRVAERAGLEPGQPLLDLGCGPGQLGIAFARLADAGVTGVDPEPEMLEAARRGATAADVAVRFVQGSSYEVGPDLGLFKMTVMGRSFHWMDRTATIAALDAITVPGGSIVLFGDRHISATPDWRDAMNAVAEKFSPERVKERKRHHGPEWPPHEAVLLGSAFADLERIGIVTERQLDIDEIVGRAFSMSVTSPQALAGQAKEFETELRRELAALSPDGTFSEIVETWALLAFRF